MEGPPPGVPERRRPDRRAALLKVAAALGVVAVLVAGVAGVVAAIAASDAEHAATTASNAAEDANRAVQRANRNAATLEDLCSVARNQRHTLKLSLENTLTYLHSPAGGEPGGLNDFIRAISLPQLRARVQAEQLPPSCKR